MSRFMIEGTTDWVWETKGQTGDAIANPTAGFVPMYFLAPSKSRFTKRERQMTDPTRYGSIPEMELDKAARYIKDSVVLQPSSLHRSISLPTVNHEAIRREDVLVETTSKSLPAPFAFSDS